MLDSSNQDIAIFNALESQADSSVFRTSDRTTFVKVCKEAHKQKGQGFPLFTWPKPGTDRDVIMPYTAFILEMDETEKAAISAEFFHIWHSATYPNGIAENIEMSESMGVIPFNIEGLSQTQNNFIGHRLADIDQDLRSIVSPEQMTTVDLYANFERVGSAHTPTHSHAVMNETWLQGGTVITDDDSDFVCQLAEGDRLFMPPMTYHRPPDPRLDEVNILDPRMSLISNACIYG